MIRRVLILVFAILFAFASVAQCDAVSVTGAIDTCFACVTNGLNTQEWIDTVLAENAGSSTDNYILNLNRYGSAADFTSFVQAASKKMQPGEISNPVSRQRCALALLSCGAFDAVPEELADETIGKLGVMSYVYGLHLLNNGAKSKEWTRQSIIEKILSLQLSDGGWAVMGAYGDVDVTSMCLLALSSCRGNALTIEKSITDAVSFLSEIQLESGGYAGMGMENAESVAQVVMALAAVGVNADTDVRFIKNGISAFDAMMAYRCESGAFRHQPGDTESNDTATIQAYQALCAYAHPGESLFVFGNLQAVEYAQEGAFGWKLWALIGIGVFAAAGIVFSLTRKRGRAKHLIFVILICGVLAAAVLFINIESASSYYNVKPPVGDEVAGVVEFSIDCRTVAGRAEDSVTPKDGVILGNCSIPFRSGDSVFDVLTYAVRMNKVHMEYEGGSETMAYIAGINYLYEKVYGDLSGWMYFVNDEAPSVGCGSCLLNDGDTVIWKYTTNLGEDLK